MQIIPVIDIRNGIAVHAVAGERRRYRTIESRLTSSAEPAEVLKALESNFKCGVCYVADLDGIEGRQLNRCTMAEMVRTGVPLIVDAGIISIEQVEALLEIGVSEVVLASESVRDATLLRAVLRNFDSDSLVFSIDLKDGELQINDPAWQGRSPLDLARFVVDQGIRQLIVLDLAVVGTGHGVPTLQLCRDIKTVLPDAKIISGGGVNSKDCVAAAAAGGLDGLLIASALHDGRLSLSELKSELGQLKSNV